MDLTFDVFRQKMTATMEKDDFWDIAENNENRYTIANGKRNMKFQYDRSDSLTEEMNKKQETPCLVFHKKKFLHETIILEMVEAIRWFKSGWVLVTIKVKEDGEICQPHFIWTEMCDAWNTWGELERTEELKDFERTMLQCIRELPEFRLYAVTGMLEGWDK